MSFFDLDAPPEQAAINEAKRVSLEKRANGIFIASLLSILFCCLGGGIAAFLAHSAKSDVLTGDFDSAERRLNIALILMILSFVIGGSAFFGQLRAGLGT